MTFILKIYILKSKILGWRLRLSGKALALHTQSPEFDPQNHLVNQRNKQTETAGTSCYICV